jgi:DNA-binding NarL/FixJ family response regulator
MSSVRVMVGDDQAVMRAGLRSLLERFPDMEVVGEAADGDEALRAVGRLQPDVALLGISLPVVNGLDATLRIRKTHRRTRVLLLSASSDEEYAREALRAGAAGCVLKSADANELVLAVRAVARGEMWLSPAVMKSVAGSYARNGSHEPPPRLTVRQREILQLLAEGNSTKQIAQRLEVSVKTVETHRAHVKERLGIHELAGLVRYAIRLGIVRSDA